MFLKFLLEITGVSKITAGLLILLLKFPVRNGYDTDDEFFVTESEIYGIIINCIIN
jgi:hypothetical protein